MRHARARLVAAVVGLATFAAVAPASPAGAENTYDALIRRTEHGIPHIKADDWGSLGFGVGYAFAEDNICVMADTFVTVNAERSKYFGPDGTYRSEANGVVPRNLDSDFYYQWINESGIIEQLVDGTHPSGSPPLSDGVKVMTEGWVEGYNAHLRDIGGADGISDPACQGAPWVRELTPTDLYRRYYQLIMFASKGALLPYIVAAEPPTPGLPGPQLSVDDFDPDALPSADKLQIGSNAYALGSEATHNGKGMVLGNPHFPWRGPERFYEFHLQSPELDVNVMGGALFGSPLVHIGVNENIAWSHTVSVPFRFTPYELKLVPGDPTSYITDQGIRQMTETTVSVEVGEGDVREHTFYESHLGPIMDFTGALMPWTPATAYALKDANEDNFRALEHFFEINQADSSAEAEDILKRHVGIPWVNTLVSDDTGDAFYADVSVVPHITDEQLTMCTTAVGEALKALARLPVLDGTRSECEPGTDPDAPVPGIYGGEALPRLHRDDYVANSNDSYWLSNPEEPLEGYPYVMGPERTERSPRTRLGIRQIQEKLDEAGETFTLTDVQEAVFSDRQYVGELVRDDLVAECEEFPIVILEDGTIVDISPACPVFENWDLQVELDSRGAVLFREFMRFGYGSDLGFWGDSFDADDPVNTPRQLNRNNPEIRQAIGKAVDRLDTAGIPLDARLGDQQQAIRNGERIEIHGGPEAGIFNYINSPWNPTEVDGRTVGYPDTTYGSSFVMTAEFTDDGPNAYGILTYSLSTDPTSPWFGDQTHLYSNKEWVKLRMTEDDIEDGKLYQYTVHG